MIWLHAGILFASYAAFGVAVVTGICFLIQDRWLKRKNPRVLKSPVPLEWLDRVNLWAVVVGSTLFVVGMGMGVWLARNQWGSFWNGDPKEVWSGLTLLAYAGILGLRWSAALRGRKVVWLSVISFLLVLFTFVGVNYLGSSRHLFF